MCYLLIITLAMTRTHATTQKNTLIEQFTNHISPIVLEDLGLILTPSSILASSSDMILQSVFLKLEKPEEPTRLCNMDCTPDLEAIQEMLTSRDEGCWIPHLVVPSSEDLQTLRKTIPKCVAACLMDHRCELITYDETSSTCILQTRADTTE